MGHTRKLYREKVREMKFQQLIDELAEIEKYLMRGRMLISKAQNPYESRVNTTSSSNYVNMKEWRYKKAIVSQLLTNMVNIN